jgi:hypothetical protein
MSDDQDTLRLVLIGVFFLIGWTLNGAWRARR